MGASADPSGFIVETRDGSTWRETGDRHQFEDTGLSAIVGSPDGWVVVGTVGMGDSAITTSWQSLDGIDWRPLGNLGPPADRIVVGLARSQDRLVAATFEIDPASTGATFPTRLFSLRATSTP